jgi:hypothetical protein
MAKEVHQIQLTVEPPREYPTEEAAWESAEKLKAKIEQWLPKNTNIEISVWSIPR